MKVLIPTGGQHNITTKIQAVVHGLDAVNLGPPTSNPGTRFVTVELAGNDRDLKIAVERVLKIGGSVSSE